MAILEIEVIENNNSPKIYLSREIDIINDFDNIEIESKQHGDSNG